MEPFIAAFYWLITWGARLLVFLLLRRRVEGLHHLPRRGAFILAANHLNVADPLLLSTALPRRIAFMAKRELFRWPLVGPLFGLYGCIPVRRFEADLTALRRARRALQAGQALGMFPEGTRSRSGGLGRGWPGTALLALQTRVPIVPVGIAGSEQITSPWALLRRPRISIRIGEPFHLPYSRIRAEEVRAGTELIMRRIAALLPHSYRGTYAQEEVSAS